MQCDARALRGGELPLPVLTGRGLGVRGCFRANGEGWTRGESPHPKFKLRLNFDLSPQAGRGDLLRRYFLYPPRINLPLQASKIRGARKHTILTIAVPFH